MPFRLKNAGAIFQRLMDQIFGYLNFVFVHLDDLLINSGTEEEHCRNLQEVSGHLSKAVLAIDMPKSDFFASELEFLRYVIDPDSIRPSPKHTAAVQDCPALRSKEDISKFLGLLNFFRSFLPDAALLLQPQSDEESAIFVWEKSQQEAFQQAKQALLNTDASRTHLGAALMQGGEQQP